MWKQIISKIDNSGYCRFQNNSSFLSYWSLLSLIVLVMDLFLILGRIPEDLKLVVLNFLASGPTF